jgi:dynein heavy chain
MVLVNLTTLQNLLNLGRKSERKAKNPPLFQVIASLSAPEVVITPSDNDIKRIVMKIQKNIVESCQPFVRWMDGTCIETPPQVVGEDEEPVIFSFYADISFNPQVLRTMFVLGQGYEKTFAKIHKYLDMWRRYKPLWKMDKVPTLERFAQKNPTVVDYDTKLMLYSKLGQEVENISTEKDIDFIRISSSPLEAAIKSETTSWLHSIGKMLHSYARQKLLDLNEEFTKTEQELNRNPETMEDLKFILNIIDKVHTSSMDIEMKYAEIEESYRTLQMHNIPIPSLEELELVRSLSSRWQSLLVHAKQVDESLVTVKIQFTETTKKQVDLFKRKVSKLKKKFKKSGPGGETIEVVPLTI